MTRGDPAVKVRQGLHLPERRHDDALFAGDQFERPGGLRFEEQDLEEATGVEVEGHRRRTRGLFGALPPEKVIGPGLRRLGFPESPKPRRMLPRIESLASCHPRRSIGEDARHRFRIPGDDDLALARQDPLGFRPPETHITHGHRRHTVDDNMFHVDRQGGAARGSDSFGGAPPQVRERAHAISTEVPPRFVDTHT